MPIFFSRMQKKKNDRFVRGPASRANLRKVDLVQNRVMMVQRVSYEYPPGILLKRYDLVHAYMQILRYCRTQKRTCEHTNKRRKSSIRQIFSNFLLALKINMTVILPGQQNFKYWPFPIACDTQGLLYSIDCPASREFPGAVSLPSVHMDLLSILPKIRNFLALTWLCFIFQSKLQQDLL